MNRYVRTRSGRVVHRPDCSTLKRGGVLWATTYPWNWAEGKTPEQIVRDQQQHNIPPVHFCKHCISGIWTVIP